MVTFVSFFLSLVTGVQPVTFAVSDPVVAIEIQLDGQTVATLRGEPWTLACDFGPWLAPHELVAIGRDGDGHEVVRKTQWINLPQERTSLDLVLENHEAGQPRSARVVWQSIEGRVPTSLQVTFDEKPLPLTDPQHISLPPYDPSELHILAAELRFGSLVYRTELPLGGVYGEAIRTELTAIPVQYTGRKAPRLEELDGWFLKRGKALKVTSIEEGPADLVMVQEPSARLQDRLRWLGGNFRNGVPTGLRNGDRFRMLLPIATGNENTTVPVELFPLSTNLASLSNGLLSPIAGRFIPGDPEIWDLAEENPRISDAVALAGLTAAAAGRPRAVILMTRAGAKDISRFKAEEVRRYLMQLRVPLVVWSPFKWKEDSPQIWGPVQETTSPFRLGRSIEGLMELLKKQAVVWVEGLHLPHQIELSPQAAEHLQWAGTSAQPPPDFGSEPSFEEWVADQEEAFPLETAASTTSERVEPANTPPTGSLNAFVDSVDVQVVNVDVVVTDRKGRPVTDLRREEFEILEDRKPVEISHFVGPNIPPQLEASLSPEFSAPEVVGESQATAPEALHLVMFVDNSRLFHAGRKLMAQTLRDFLDQDLPPRTKFMLLTYNGRLNVRQPFTTDPAQLVARLEATITGNAQAHGKSQDRQETSNRLAQISKNLELAARTGDASQKLTAEDNQRALLAEIDAQEAEESQDIRKTVAALERLVESLGGVEGRKVLMYIGDSLAFSPTRALAAGIEKAAHPTIFARAHDGGQKPDLGIPRLFQALTDRANANRVTVYTVTPPLRDQVNDVTAESAGMDVRTAIQDTSISNIKEAMCMMSNTTGGLCQVGGAQPARIFEKTRQDFAATYSLAYSPTHPGNGDFHRIQVNVRRPGLQVRHREGFVDRPTEDRLRDRLSAALHFDADQNPLGLEIEFEKEEPLEKNLHLVKLRLKVPVSRLVFLPAADPTMRATRLKLLITTMDERRQKTAVQEIPISFQVAAHRLLGDTVLIYSHQVHLTLEEGEQRFALGLWDELGHSGSFLSRGVTIGQGLGQQLSP